MHNQTTNNTVHFTVAQMEDVHQLQPMVAGLYQEFVNPESHQGTAPQIDLTLAELLNKPEKGTVIAIRSNNELAGYAIIIYFWSNEYGGNVIEIDELYVAPEHRSKGLGKSFFDWLFKEYENSSGFVLQVSRTNDRARKLYEAVGFIQSSACYMHRIK